MKTWIPATSLGITLALLAPSALAGPRQGVRCPGGFDALISDNNRKLVCRRVVQFERDAICLPGFRLHDRGAALDMCVFDSSIPNVPKPPPNLEGPLAPTALPIGNLPWHEIVAELRQAARAVPARLPASVLGEDEPSETDRHLAFGAEFERRLVHQGTQRTLAQSMDVDMDKLLTSEARNFSGQRAEEVRAPRKDFSDRLAAALSAAKSEFAELSRGRTAVEIDRLLAARASRAGITAEAKNHVDALGGPARTMQQMDALTREFAADVLAGGRQYAGGIFERALAAFIAPAHARLQRRYCYLSVYALSGAAASPSHYDACNRRTQSEMNVRRSRGSRQRARGPLPRRSFPSLRPNDSRRDPVHTSFGIRKLAACAAIAALLAALAQPAVAQAPAVGSGAIELRVRSGGAAVANATVCVGIAGDLNLFFQGVTDAQGAVRIAPIPTERFVVTAHTSGAAAQTSLNPPMSGFMLLTLDLQPGASPRCPATIAAGPNRKLVGEIKPPTSDLRPSELTRVRRTEFCFGAVGMGCGQAPPGIPVTAACALGACVINGGSWDHDTCCYANPGGYACAGGAADAVGLGPGSTSAVCRAEWDKAVRLTTKGLSWTRQVDFSRGNATGQVEHALFCAPSGTLVPPEDAGKCCSRSTRGLGVAERAIAESKLETLRACQ